jgi:hypothetical protein
MFWHTVQMRASPKLSHCRMGEVGTVEGNSAKNEAYHVYRKRMEIYIDCKQFRNSLPRID